MQEPDTPHPDSSCEGKTYTGTAMLLYNMVSQYIRPVRLHIHLSWLMIRLFNLIDKTSVRQHLASEQTKVFYLSVKDPCCLPHYFISISHIPLPVIPASGKGKIQQPFLNDLGRNCQTSRGVYHGVRSVS